MTTPSDRPTPDSLGGGPPAFGPDHSRLAGRMLTQGRQSPTVDERASASLERLIADHTARHVKLSGSGVAVAGTPLVILAGGPRPGYVWHVRRLNVGPVDYAAGAFPTPTMILAVVGPQEEPGNMVDDAQHVVSMTTAYPSEATWGRSQVTLQSGDHLRVIVVGLAAGVQVTVGGQADETAAAVGEIYGL